MDTDQTYDVFLSHAHPDARQVERLGIRLEDEANLSVWLDKWVLIPGEHWQQEMAKGLDRARCCAVCIGNNTPSGWFRDEIERALSRQARDRTFRVIPVILPGGNGGLVDDFLELRTWVDFKDGVDDGSAFHVLLAGVKGVPPGRFNSGSAVPETGLIIIRESLIRIRSLRHEQLIDDDIALEYQRRLLDKLIAREDR